MPRLGTPGTLTTGGATATLAATDALDFAEAWDEVVIAGATARAFRALNLNEMADSWFTTFQSLAADTARRHQVEGEDLDYGPPIEMPYFQMPF